MTRKTKRRGKAKTVRRWMLRHSDGVLGGTIHWTKDGAEEYRMVFGFETSRVVPVQITEIEG